jgi:hypothetical protein
VGPLEVAVAFAVDAHIDGLWQLMLLHSLQNRTVPHPASLRAGPLSHRSIVIVIVLSCGKVKRMKKSIFQVKQASSGVIWSQKPVA